MQNRAGRVILKTTGRYSDTPVAAILHDLGWSDLESRRKFHLDLTTFKIIHRGPPYLKTKLVPVYSVHSRATRSSSNSLFYVPRFRTTTGQRSFAFRAPTSVSEINRGPGPLLEVLRYLL